jgi:predicted DsbA family dithiol-disulfide isomerase
MMKTVRVDFVSDISCPWCIIGLRGLELATDRIGHEVGVELHFQPFELEPELPRGGTNLADRIRRKFDRSPEGVAGMFQDVADRAAQVGFAINLTHESRLYNTFDAHRLLDWARSAGRQHSLKKALFESHFTRGEAIDDPEVLASVARRAGLDGSEARAVLASGRHAKAVHQSEAHWRALGIQSVPTIVLNEKYLISGGQPVELFEEALRQVAQESALATPTVDPSPCWVPR